MRSLFSTLQDAWIVVLGCALSLTGLALAAWTLVEPRLAERAAAPDTDAPAQPRRLDSSDEWERVVGIAEQRLASIDAIADLQARAREEIAAADRDATQLLADWAAFSASQAPPGSEPAGADGALASEPTPRSLAA